MVLVDFFKKHIALLQLTGALMIAASIMPILFINYVLSGTFFDSLWSAVIIGLVMGLFFGWPIIVGILNIYYLFRKRPLEAQAIKNERICSFAAIFIGGIYAILISGMIMDIKYVPWDEQLYNAQMHSPIDPYEETTIVALLFLWAIGYFGIRIINVKKVPPLVPVLFIAMIYIGIAVGLVWIIQTVRIFFSESSTALILYSLIIM